MSSHEQRGKSGGRWAKRVAAAAGAFAMGTGLAACSTGNAAPQPTVTITETVTAPSTPEALQGELRLTDEQLANASRAARGTALTILQETKGNGPDQYNGFGQYMVTQTDEKNGYGQAAWFRAEKYVDGTAFGLEYAAFKSKNGSLSDETQKTTESVSLDFTNPNTDVFADSKLTFEEITEVLKDPKTKFVGGSKEYSGDDFAAYVYVNGELVTAQTGPDVKKYDYEGNPMGLTFTTDQRATLSALETVINK